MIRLVIRGPECEEVQNPFHTILHYEHNLTAKRKNWIKRNVMIVC